MMRLLRVIRQRLRFIFRGEETAAEIEREIAWHLEQLTRENIAAGMGAAQARLAARRTLGNTLDIGEQCRDQRRLNWLADALQDCRFALRTIHNNPGFTAVAALSLALGIGANTAIFSFMDAIFLRALPVADPESLVVMQWQSKGWPSVVHFFTGTSFAPGGKTPTSIRTSDTHPYGLYELLAASPVLSHTFAFASAGRLNLQIQGQADLAEGQYVTGAFFSGLGVPPAAGRLIGADDDRAGAAPVAVLSYRFAQRRFGEVGNAVGQPIRINDNSFTIAGVAAPEFFGVNPVTAQDIYLPLHANVILEAAYNRNPGAKYLDPNHYWVQIMARLRQGVGKEQAQAELGPLFSNFMKSAAKTEQERANLPALVLADGGGGLDYLRRQFSKPLYILMTLVGLILAIACTNLTNLLLARASSRQREIAVRLSLGAGRWRIVRQLLTESVLLAFIGGLGGALFAAWGIRALTLLIVSGSPDLTLNAELNWRVLAVTAALALGTGLLLGLAPALQATRVNVIPALKQTRASLRLSLPGRLRMNLSQALAVSQIAITVFLLVVAGLFLRTLRNLNAVELGFNRERVLLFTVNAMQAGYRKEAVGRFYEDLQTRLQTIPGVRSVSASNYALVSGGRYSWGDFSTSGYSRGKVNVSGVDVAPGFFSAMQIPLLLGREIEWRDLHSKAPVAVVNEVLVKTFFPGENPLGRRFSLAGLENIEIVGVAKNARYQDLKRELPPLVYFCYAQRPPGQLVFALRAAGDPTALAGSVRQTVRAADSRVPIWDLTTQDRQIERGIAPERMFAMLCTCFAVLALVIACVGLYGMMAYRVARRTNEIGLRMALGAERPMMIWMVLREVLWLSLAGLAIGLPMAFAASRVVESFLFQMKPRDPLTFALAPALLLAAALFAGYGPARRASRVDPMVALRYE